MPSCPAWAEFAEGAWGETCAALSPSIAAKRAPAAANLPDIFR